MSEATATTDGALRRAWIVAVATAGCVDPPGGGLLLGATDHPDLPMAQEIRVEAQIPVAIGLVCTSDTDPEEVHVVTSAPEGIHTVRLVGLLADHRYTCVATASGGQIVAPGQVTFDTPRIPWADALPDVQILETDRARFGHYTLFNHARVGAGWDQRVLIVDPEGRIRWAWTFDEPVNAAIEAEWDGEALLVGGGGGLAPRRMTLWGEILTEIGPPYTGGDDATYHHEALQLPDGGLLGLATTRDLDADGETYEGFSVGVFDPDSGALRYGYASRTGVDAGDLVPLEAGLWDPFHANAVLWTDDVLGPALWVNLKRSDALVRIDRLTGEVSRILGPQGDVALVDPAGGPGWFTGQHAPELDGDRLLIFDNGVRRADGVLQTRVVEYQVDLVDRTAWTRWSFTRPGWYEPFHGDADRLPNGHVLVASGHCHGCDGGDAAGHSFVLEVDPQTEEIVWEMQLAAEDAIYRADVLHGCDLFANRRYCPAGNP